MTTVHQVFSIRSFKSAKDREFIKALRIYDANTHPQSKTDSREIAHWLHKGAQRADGRFYVCGLFISAVLVGYVEFIYLKDERLIHFDYFIIDPERRSAGAFHIFAEQMRDFFLEEGLEWDFITAEISHLNCVDGVSRQAQRLIRLFRQIGFCEALVKYRQPLLGLEHPDTAIQATLLVLPRVEMDVISRSRFLELISAIYRKHYAEWYSIYTDTAEEYMRKVDALFVELEADLAGHKTITLHRPDRDFIDSPVNSGPPLRGALMYFAKILASGIAAAAFHILLRHESEFSTIWMIGIPLSVFVLLAITISLADKRRYEAFKLLVSLVSKFFDR